MGEHKLKSGLVVPEEDESSYDMPEAPSAPPDTGFSGAKADETIVDEPAEQQYPPGDPRNNPEARNVMTAFLVFIDPDGTAIATPDCNMDIILERPATLQDMKRAAHEIVDDVLIIEMSNAVIAKQMQTAAAVQQQAQVAKMQQALAKKGMRPPAGHPLHRPT